MQIKFYKSGKLLGISNALPHGSSERDRHVLSIITPKCNDYDSYTVDNERIICNVVGPFKRMIWAKNPKSLGDYPVHFYTGLFLDVYETKTEDQQEKIGKVIRCQVCKKELTIQWFGIFHFCYHVDAQQTYRIDEDLYDLETFSKINKDFWREVNDL